MQDQFEISFNFGAKDNNFEFSSGVIKNVTNKSGIIGGPLNLNVAQDTKLNGAFYMQIGTKEGTPKY